MQIDEKEKEMLDILTSANSIMPVKDIAKKLFISEPTARRRLSALAEKNLVVRTHGGAIINYNMTQNKSIPLYLRISSTSEGKNAIAQKAVKLIKDGNVIFLDASSSAFHLLPYLKNFHDLLICTNSLKTAITLAEMDIKTVCLGGDVNTSNLACNSSETLETLSRFNADILFFSCDAMSEDGLLTDNSKEASYVRTKLMKNAAVKVLLIDNTKLNKRCWHTLGSVKDVDYVFCNEPLPENIRAMLKNDTESTEEEPIA